MEKIRDITHAYAEALDAEKLKFFSENRPRDPKHEVDFRLFSSIFIDFFKFC